MRGLVPLSLLEDDFYEFDAVRRQIRGRRNGTLIALGDTIMVEVAKVDQWATTTDAFNEGNAEDLVNHWAKNGVWMDRDTGEKVTGRAALLNQFSTIFADPNRPRLSVNVDSIRFVTESVAVEEGVATLVGPDGPSETSYTAIHVKEDGKWRVNSVRENALAAPAATATAAEGHLQQLEWMIGDIT